MDSNNIFLTYLSGCKAVIIRYCELSKYKVSLDYIGKNHQHRVMIHKNLPYQNIEVVLIDDVLFTSHEYVQTINKAIRINLQKPN